MNSKRRALETLAVAAFVGTLWLPAPAMGQGPEAAGMITGIKVGRGQVEVRPVGLEVWRRAEPLLGLRAGDLVRASEDASVVILLSGGRGSVTVEAANSPHVVSHPPPGESRIEKARALLEAALGFLAATAAEAPRAILSTRAGILAPVILSPRNGPILPDSLSFEWLGRRFSRYTVQIVTPTGAVIEKKDVTGARFDHPADAPPLSPGVRYTFRVLSASYPPQEAWFEVLDPNRAQAVRRDLMELEQSLGPGASLSTRVALQAGFLASRGLLHDARLALIAGLAKDPDEPTFHLLLGQIYEKVGLTQQAAEAFDEARFLTSGPGKP